MRAFVRVCVNLSVCEGTEGGKEGKTSNLLKYLNPVLSAYYYKLCDWPRGTIAAGEMLNGGLQKCCCGFMVEGVFPAIHGS